MPADAYGMRALRAITVLTALAVLGVAGAACGVSSTKTVTVDRTRTVTTTVTTTTPRTTSPTRVTGGGSGASASTPRCRTGQLAFTYATNGATGSILIGGALTNHSSSTCSLFGYPGLGLIGTSGQTLPTHVLRRSGPVIPNVAERLVVLAPGGKADFFANFRDADPPPCPLASKLEVTPPNAYSHLSVDFGFTACRGEIYVSPVFAPGSTSSY
jgi:hypothetical protein